ncbi:MAG: hypothetical protein ABI811_02900 [Acidobacteriota bacterium]
MVSIMVSGRDGNIYVGPGNTVSQHGVFRSVDHGRSFEFAPFPTTARNLIVWTIFEDSDSGTLYASTESADHPQPYSPPLFRSIDRGLTWEDVTGVIPWHVIRFGYNAASKEVLAVTEGAGVYKTMDQGRTWTLVSYGPSIDFLIDPRAPGRFWAARQTTQLSASYPARDSILLSPDAGLSWVPAGLPDRNSNIVINKAGTRLYAGTFPSGMFIASTIPDPRLNFTALSGTDGGTTSFACSPVKFYLSVKLTVDQKELPLVQALTTEPFPFKSVTCSFSIPLGTTPGNHPAKLTLDGYDLPFTLKVASGTAAVATAMTTVLFTNPEKFAPGDIVSVFGLRLTKPSATVGTSNLASPPFPLNLNQVRVLVLSASNTVFSAAIQFAFTDTATGASQINIQLPTNLPAGNYKLRVDRLTAAGQVDSTAPSLDFSVGTYQPMFLGNASYPVFLQNITQDPTGNTFATPQRPSRPGDILTLYATGMGITTPALTAGTIPGALTRIAAQPTNQLETAGGRLTAVTPIGGVVASPQFPGLYQMSIQIPADIDTSQSVILRHELGSVRVDIPIPVNR